jgi:hypothetical protein
MPRFSKPLTSLRISQTGFIDIFYWVIFQCKVWHWQPILILQGADSSNLLSLNAIELFLQIEADMIPLMPIDSEIFGVEEITVNRECV